VASGVLAQGGKSSKEEHESRKLCHVLPGRIHDRCACADAGLRGDGGWAGVFSGDELPQRAQVPAIVHAQRRGDGFGLFELYIQSQQWETTFLATADGTYLRGDNVFSNGYRYMNWSIDVPVLLLQLVIVLRLEYQRAVSTWARFAVAGLAMIYTGYVGQFYEVSNLTQFLVWGTISTVFSCISSIWSGPRSASACPTCHPMPPNGCAACAG
jgi:hypothetical protein